MKKALIVHHCDSDGYGAAAILTYVLGRNEVDFIEANYDTPLRNLIKNTNYHYFYFVDYSISTKENAEFIKKLDDQVGVTWIDHHKSSIDMIEKMPELSNIYGYRVIGISGTGLTWIYALSHLALDTEGIKDYELKAVAARMEQVSDTYTAISKDMGNVFLRKMICPKTLHLINRWDIWDVDDRIIDFHYGLDINGPDDLLSIFKSEEIDYQTQAKAIDDGAKICRYIKKEDKENCDKNGFELTINYEGEKYRCFALNTNHYSSLAFGDRMNEYDICMPFSYNGKCWRYSMYTIRKDIDCSIIAKSLGGGGGHPQAAGFSTSDLIARPGKELFTEHK